jgi:sugar lactone lactonase YvrE
VDGGFAFQADDGFFKIPAEYKFNEVAGVTVDENDSVYVFTRAPMPDGSQGTVGRILVFDKTGTFQHCWGEGFYGGRAHAIHASPDGAIYAVENLHHAIEKWDKKGNQLWTLGETGKPAPKWSGQPFNLPTHLAVSEKTGDIFVADGYGNNSIHRFTNDGKLLATWGTHGIEPGNFQCPHNICVDEDEYVYVADRENNRIQVFDGYGHLEAVWHDIYRPSALCFKDGYIYCGELLHDPHPLLADCTEVGHRIDIFTKHGRLVSRLGSKVEGDGAGEFIAPHGICVDSQGNVIVGEVSFTEKGRRIERVFTSLRRLKKV